MAEQNLVTFLEERKIRYHRDASIKPYVTIGIGGTAGLIIPVGSETHLKELLSHLHQEHYRYVLLGGGSNVLFADDCSGLIVVINRTADILKAEGHLLKVNRRLGS